MLYDDIGKSYHTRRRADARIASVVLHALGNADSVANVGAGTGSYEPTDRTVIAVEPSMTMIAQRCAGAAAAIQARAEQLPLRDKCVSAALAILTVHHWNDVSRGLAELVRVSRDRVVILTYDPLGPGFWLTNEYFPAIRADDRKKFPSIARLAQVLGQLSVHNVPVPRDCSDGFLGAFWARPHAYLDPEVRSGMSSFHILPGLNEGLLRLQDDLASGAWHRKFGSLAANNDLDIGYRLVVADTRLL